MSSGEVYNILISRSKYIERDRSIAIIRLEQQCQHLVGQPVMVRYYTNEEQTETDAVVAIGIKNGIGKDCFKVISLGGLLLVRNVYNLLPDVSTLVHGEIYLCPDENGTWSYVYEDGGIRQVEPITGGPFVFSSIEDKYRWFYRDGELKREDDFNTTEEVNEKFSEYNKKIEDIVKKLDELEELVLKNNTELFPIRVSFYDESNSGGAHTIYQTGLRTGVNFVIRVTTPEVNLETGDITTLDVTKDCKFTLNDQNIQLTQENLYTVENISKTTDYTLSVSYVDPITKIKKNGSAFYTVEFGYLFKYGKIPSTEWIVNEENINSLNNSIVGNKNTLIRFSDNLTNERVAISAPTAYGDLKLAYDPSSGLNCITDYKTDTISIDGIDYKVYIKEIPIRYNNFTQLFSYNELSNINGGNSNSTNTSSSSDLESLRQEILGGASSDYNTLYKIEQKIKGSSTREGLVAGNGISIVDNEDGSSTISVKSDNSSIDVNSNDEIKVNTIDGGYY